MKGIQSATKSLRPSFLSRDPALPLNVWIERDPRNGVGGWSLYTSGFRMAADELVTHPREESVASHLSYFVVYPIAFLYRQYIELRLKQILWSTGAAIPKKHGLMTLWDQVREQLKYYKPQDKRYWRKYERVGSLLRPFDDLDPRAEGFRYPYDKEGRLTISDDIKWLNLVRMKQHVDEAAALLDDLYLC